MAKDVEQFTTLRTESSGLKRYVVGVGLLVTAALLTHAVALERWRGAMDQRMERAEQDIAVITTMHVSGGSHP